MAKFCKYCGSPLEEGQVCNCAGAQAAANPAPQAPVATAAPAAPGKGSAILEELKSLLLTGLKTPKQAEAQIVASGSKLAMAGIFAGINALVVLLYFWKLPGSLIASLGSLFGAMGNAVTGQLKLEYPFGVMLACAIIAPVVFIGLSGLALFVAGKLTKKELNIVDALCMASASSLYPTIMVLLATVLGLISGNLQIYGTLVAAVIWMVQGYDAIRDHTGLKATVSAKNLIITVALMAVVGGICGWIGYALIKWEIESIFASMMSGLGGLGGFGDLGSLF